MAQGQESAYDHALALVKSIQWYLIYAYGPLDLDVIISILMAHIRLLMS